MSTIVAVTDPQYLAATAHVDDGDTVFATGTNAAATADTSGAGTYLLHGCFAWYVHATQVGFLTLTVDPAGTPKLYGRARVDESTVQAALGFIILPVPTRIVLAGSEVIRAELDAGGVGVVANVRLFVEQVA